MKPELGKFIKSAATTGLKTLNEVGSATSFGATKVFSHLNKAANRADEFVKRQKVDATVNKDTFIGAAVVATALVLAGKCIKGIKDKITKMKQDSIEK